MRLLEREAHLSALTEYADEARAGNGRLVLVHGDAGIGKSALVEELETTLADAAWYWGACDGLFVPRPLAPLRDIASRLGGELLDLCRNDASRDQLFAAFAQQINQVGGLTVFVFEDVQWADDATLDLLRFLGRRIRDARSLLLVTYRDDGIAADDPLRVALGELTTQATTRRLSLPPLTAQAVHGLTAGTGLEPSEVYRLTAGNPFYLTEILRHGIGELPASARDAVLARVGRVSSEARQVLDVVALAGSRVEPALLEVASEGAAGAIDELVSRGLLVGDGERLCFRHEIARLAVDGEIAVHRRSRIHRRILDSLLAVGCDDDARLAFHAEGAADAKLVLSHAPDAARRASELSAHREAVAQYARALRFAGSADARIRAGLYDALAQECSLVDRWQDSADARQSALDLWREVGDRRREGDSLRCLARAMWRLCRGDEDRAAAEEAVRVLQPLGPSPELARAYVYQAGTLGDLSQYDAALALVDRALALADQLDLADVTCDALNTAGCVLASAGDPAWQAPLDRAIDVAIDAGLHELAGRVYSSQYELHCWDLRFADGERYFVDGVAYCDEHDISTYGTCLRGARTAVLARMGRLTEGLALAEQLLSRTGASPVNRLNPLISLGRLRARRGEPAAWEGLDEADDLSARLGESTWILLTRLARAEARWLEDDEVGAADEWAMAAATLDRRDRVACGEVAVWARRLGREVPAGDVPPAHALQVAGDHCGAAREWDRLGCHYDAALALLDAGDEASVREALTRFQSYGALAAARRARQRLRGLGVTAVPAGARPSTRDHPAGLTRRQREVLELICDGRTNDEISDRLFISAKTVDHHVSAVLSKLGVHSRRIAAAEAVRLGLVPATRTTSRE